MVNMQLGGQVMLSEPLASNVMFPHLFKYGYLVLAEDGNFFLTSEWSYIAERRVYESVRRPS